ncbi:hypothetical protein BJY52DRAFT_1313092, partial [Lactarius psammicola]
MLDLYPRKRRMNGKKTLLLYQNLVRYGWSSPEGSTTGYRKRGVNQFFCHFFAVHHMLFAICYRPFTTCILLWAFYCHFAIWYPSNTARCWLFTARVLLRAVGCHFAICYSSNAVCCSLSAVHRMHPAVGLRPLFCYFAICYLPLAAWYHPTHPAVGFFAALFTSCYLP